ncbi:alpha/beta hydrolase family protein [Granulosicoccus sp. 3-233]|uniref:alpha/beta hydrolase family protein n=1 Tax=Granulosicoccus sp. 3-233 TaxID=3417969 RepID=UPI003D337883
MLLTGRTRPMGTLALMTTLMATMFAALPAHSENRIDTQRPDAPELAAYGSHEVGTRPLTLTNPDQVNVLALDPSVDAPDPLPTHDRELVVQMWYPSYPGATGSKTLRAFLRDPTIEVDLHGQATLWAAPVINSEPFPLVIVSHGYPGNRFLLSHLAENIASKGYVVASIDHTDSTYRTQAAFGSTLRNRSLDQIFVLEEMTRLNADPASFLHGLIDTDNTAVIGYSMGGYGAVITAGGGVTAAAVDFPFSPPHGTLGIHQSGSDSHNNLPDPRIKTAIAFAPWGRNTGFWDAETLQGVQIPMLFVAGSEDDVSLYEGGVRDIWKESINIDRALLTFEHANHNAAAPYPAPAESYAFSQQLGFAPFGHYADAVWDTVRMNNIAQHFTTAWLDRYLKSDIDKQAYLELIEDSNDGVYATNDDGSFAEEHTYWKGFEARSAKGLMFEWMMAGESAE